MGQKPCIIIFVLCIFQHLQRHAAKGARPGNFEHVQQTVVLKKYKLIKYVYIAVIHTSFINFAGILSQPCGLRTIGDRTFLGEFPFNGMSSFVTQLKENP